MDRDELKARLMATFLGELEEHVRTLNGELLALEKASEEAARAEHLRALFRTVHSLKSAARSVQVSPIEALCHHLEEFLLPVRDGSGALDPELAQLLFEAADALEEAAGRLRQEQALGDSRLAALLDRVSELGTAAAAATPSPKPSPKPRVTPLSAAPRAPEEPSAGPSPRAPMAGSVVRVAPEKLDVLIAQGGELRVARQRGKSRAGDLEALRGFVGTWEEEWSRSAERPLRQMLRRGSNGRGHAALPAPAARSIGRTRENLRRLRRDVDRLIQGFAADARALERAAGALEQELHGVRLLPFSEACQGLERHVRDLARATGKQVELSIAGGDVEIDRSILQALRDPLLHLVRNAVDHGIELSSERTAAGKRAPGRIEVQARLLGDRVQVSVADDGRGIDVEALRAHCAKRGLTLPEGERDLVRLIFAPAVSTARMLTGVSGRGVGLDAVKTQIEALHGVVDVDYEPGKGSRFVLLLPRALTSIRVLMVQTGGQTLAIPQTNVLRLLRVTPSDLGSIEGRDTLLLPEGPVPAAFLAEALGFSGGPPVPSARKIPMVLVAAAENQMAFTVDELLEEQDVVVKPLGSRLRGRRVLSGATILPSGNVALILNIGAVIREALDRDLRRSLSAMLGKPAPALRKQVLVVDDSVTTRTLEKSILESSGFEVIAAADGQEAWELLQARGADLIVADVEMPRMDGFQLTEAVRASKRFRALPVVLVTALESDHDKARGLEVGADAYLPKSAFDQKTLLDAIRQLV